MIKSILFRMFIVYMVSSFFRRSPAPTTNEKGEVVNPVAPTAAANLFFRGTNLVRIQVFGSCAVL
jgi:hypothetical protein